MTLRFAQEADLPILAQMNNRLIVPAAGWRLSLPAPIVATPPSAPATFFISQPASVT